MREASIFLLSRVSFFIWVRIIDLRTPSFSCDSFVDVVIIGASSVISPLLAALLLFETEKHGFVSILTISDIP